MLSVDAVSLPHYEALLDFERFCTSELLKPGGLQRGLPRFFGQ